MSRTIKRRTTSVTHPPLPDVMPEAVIVIVVVGAYTALRAIGIPQDGALTGLTLAVSLGVRAAVRIVSAVRTAARRA